MDISDCRPPKGNEDAASLWLYAEELTQRSLSAYVSILSVISAALPKVTDCNTRLVLDNLARTVYGLARLHKALLPPSALPSQSDVSESLQALCEAVSEFALEERGIFLSLASEPVLLDSRQVWRIGLVVFELVMNASRQAFADRVGFIRVDLARDGSDILCVVSDNGSGLRLDPVPGLSGRVVKALAKDLSGQISCKIGDGGTTVQLRFPVCEQ
jgi:two-component sensor histidine kinase